MHMIPVSNHPRLLSQKKGKFSMATTTITIGDRQFILDQDKAEAAFAAKKVINGRQTMFFNILPLKYQWAYDLYKKMKANHWEPEDIQMGKDIEQWRDEQAVSEIERWIIRIDR